MFQVVDSLSHQRGAHALRAGVDFLFNDDAINYPRSYRGAYTFSSLANFLSGTYNNAGFTQTFGVSDVHQTNPNVGLLRAGRVEGRVRAHAEPRAALRPADARDDQHRHQQRVAAARLRLVAVRLAPHHRPRQRRAVLRSRAAARAGQRAAVGRQHHRPRASCSRRHQPVADPGGRAGVSRTSWPAPVPVGHAGQSDDDGPRICRTRIRGRRASRSSSSSATAARSASATSTCAAWTC